MMRHAAITPFIAALVALLAACTKGGDARLPDDTVAAVGNVCLTRGDIAAVMPAALTPDDSAAFVKAYARQWVEAKLIENVASQQVDIDEINKLVEEYRRELIMNSYRRAMASRGVDAAFAEDSLRAYYEAHKVDFKLERPLIKGIYLKVPSGAASLGQLRRLYRSDRPADMDRLEKAALESAIHYDYFRDSWVDWEQIETRIPLEFTDADIAALASRRYVETESQGFVYLLSVSDYLPAGAIMPFEAARGVVRERLLTQRRRAFDTALRRDLYHTAVANGTVTIRF